MRYFLSKVITCVFRKKGNIQMNAMIMYIFKYLRNNLLVFYVLQQSKYKQERKILLQAWIIQADFLRKFSQYVFQIYQHFSRNVWVYLRASSFIHRITA